MLVLLALGFGLSAAAVVVRGAMWLGVVASSCSAFSFGALAALARTGAPFDASPTSIAAAALGACLGVAVIGWLIEEHKSDGWELWG